MGRKMSYYRRGVWFIKGLREYTKSGYEKAAKSFAEGDLDVKCDGKSYMITGANSGLGKHTAMEIAKRGGTVHMVCRNPQAANEARDEIVKATDNMDIHVHILDMAKPRDVHKFAKEFRDKNEKLNCLINNAGCLLREREVTEDGLEKNFATNTVGTHILSEALFPLLESSEDPRLIIVTSGGMLNEKLDLSDLQTEKMDPYDGTRVYSQNKRQQVVMTKKYGERHPGVKVWTMHPGWADTPAVRTSIPEFYEKMKDRLRSVEQGADTLVWLAVSKAAAVKHESGLFFQDREPVSKHLPLAWTKHSSQDEDKLMELLHDYYIKFDNK